MVSSALRSEEVEFVVVVTVMVALPEPEVADISAHDGAPVSLQSPRVVMVNVFSSPAAAKLSEAVDTLRVGVSALPS